MAEPHLNNETPNNHVEFDLKKEGDVQPTRIERPNDAQTIVQQHADMKTYEIPPRGIWRGSHGLFAFSLFWNTFMIVFTFGMIFAKQANIPFFAYLIVALFWVIGVGIFVGAINMGRRKVIIGVLRDQIMIEHKSIFGTQWTELPTADIARVVVGPSGMTINDIPIMELQFFKSDGKKIGLLSQLENHELHWLAGELGTSLSPAQEANDS